MLIKYSYGLLSLGKKKKMLCERLYPRSLQDCVDKCIIFLFLSLTVFSDTWLNNIWIFLQVNIYWAEIFHHKSWSIVQICFDDTDQWTLNPISVAKDAFKVSTTRGQMAQVVRLWDLWLRTDLRRVSRERKHSLPRQPEARRPDSRSGGSRCDYHVGISGQEPGQRESDATTIFRGGVMSGAPHFGACAPLGLRFQCSQWTSCGCGLRRLWWSSVPSRPSSW